jgi:hypothetical protein
METGVESVTGNLCSCYGQMFGLFGSSGVPQKLEFIPPKPEQRDSTFFLSNAYRNPKEHWFD